MKDLFFKVGQTEAQRALTLYDFLNDNEVLEYAKAAGYFPSADVEVAMHMINQMKKHRMRMLDTNKNSPHSGGHRVNSDRQGAERNTLGGSSKFS
jgi:hypothetical protein